MRRIIPAVARRYGVPASTLLRVLHFQALARRVWPRHAALVLAVIATESAGNPHAVTEDGPGSFDLGLMQVNTGNFAAVGLTWRRALYAAPNVRAGTAILRTDVAHYGPVYGLEVYNAGPGGIGVDWAYPERVRGWLRPIQRALTATASP